VECLKELVGSTLDSDIHTIYPSANRAMSSGHVVMWREEDLHALKSSVAAKIGTALVAAFAVCCVK